MLAVTANRLLTPSDVVEYPLLLIDGGRILEMTTPAARSLPAGVATLDLGDAVIAPGYIDLHIHGGAGLDVMRESADALAPMEQLLARHGVTSYYPTTVTAPIDAILSALGRLAGAIETRGRDGHDGRGRARPLGIHLEGPFISHARRGVHPEENLLPPNLANFERFWQAARGHIRVMTIAPELEGAMELIAEAARRGVCVSLGHSDASFVAAEHAVSAGARHATHTFNAMRPLDHRDPGILGAVLTDSRLSADIIADGIHLDPAIVKLFATAKGPDNAVLITDAISATGMPDGRYQLGPIEVDVKDGKCTYNGSLAGSVLTMDRAVRNVTQFSSWSLRDAVRAATHNPARAVGMAETYGVLAPGASADFVVLSPAGEVMKTIVGGRGL